VSSEHESLSTDQYRRSGLHTAQIEAAHGHRKWPKRGARVTQSDPLKPQPEIRPSAQHELDRSAATREERSPRTRPTKQRAALAHV
jgi:hypothetical protein